jgi:uncharacterized membrane protein YbhN (UPF0104 family)
MKAPGGNPGWNGDTRVAYPTQLDRSEESPVGPQSANRKVVGWLTQGVIGGLVAYYLVQSVWTNWSQIRNHTWHLHYGWLLSSVAVLLGSMMVMALGWYAALRELGASISPWHAQRIWIVTNFLKYLPGKVWLVIARVFHGQRHGIPKVVTLTSFAYEYVLFMASGILVAACTVPFWLQRGEARTYGWTLWLVPATLVGFHPAIFGPLVNRALKWVRRPPLARQIPFPRLLLLLLLFGWAWLLFGLAFCLFVTAVQPMPLAAWPTLSGAFVASWVLGLLVIFTPGGLGVREGMLIMVLSSLSLAYLPAASARGVAVVLALGSRLWMVLSEVVGLGLAVAFIRDPAAPSLHLPDPAEAGEILGTEA